MVRPAGPPVPPLPSPPLGPVPLPHRKGPLNAPAPSHAESLRKTVAEGVGVARDRPVDGPRTVRSAAARPPPPGPRKAQGTGLSEQGPRDVHRGWTPPPSGVGGGGAHNDTPP